MSAFPVIDAAKVIIRTELDLYHAQHGHPRPVTICDLESGYDAAHRAMGRPTPSSAAADAGKED